MIDWNLALKLAIGGYGTNIIVLVILLTFAWVIGIVVQKYMAKNSKKENPKKV